jgi:hypothetical protein
MRVRRGEAKRFEGCTATAIGSVRGRRLRGEGDGNQGPDPRVQGLDRSARVGGSAAVTKSRVASFDLDQRAFKSRYSSFPCTIASSYSTLAFFLSSLRLSCRFLSLVLN